MSIIQEVNSFFISHIEFMKVQCIFVISQKIKKLENPNRIGGIMVSMLDAIGVDCGFETVRVKPKTIKLVFATSSLSTQY
jgi:hypothetical protein